jgi:hypothetical protein
MAGVVRVAVRMLAVMAVGVTVFDAVSMAMGMRMDAERCVVMDMRVLVGMVMRVAMHRAVGMHMGMPVAIPFHPGFAFAATANCTHSRLPTRFRFP